MVYEKPISSKNNKMDKGILFSALFMDNSSPKWTKSGVSGMLKFPFGMSNFSEMDLLSPFHGVLSHTDDILYNKSYGERICEHENSIILHCSTLEQTGATESVYSVIQYSTM